MSWVKVNTYNLIDRFQVRTRQEIFKFHQLNIDYNDYNLSIWIQDERDELNYQLKTMFDEMKEWLGFYPRPIWKKIKVPLDQYDSYWNKILTIPESAWLIDLGVRNVELVEAGATYVKSPLTGQALNVTFTITADEITDGEIALFHKESDAFDNVADDRFRVLPSQIYYNGTAYVITVPYARLIKPELWNTQFINGDPLQRKEYLPTDDSNFVTELDVYRVYNDSTIKGKLIGPPFDYSSDETLQTQEVNITIIDSEDATFKIQGNQSVVSFNPTHIEVWAYIGYPLTDEGYMNSIIEEFIIRKARVEMGINARLAEAKISTQWQYDNLPAYSKFDVQSGQGGVGYRPNPIGARNVDIEAFIKLMPICNYRGKLLDTRLYK